MENEALFSLILHNFLILVETMSTEAWCVHDLELLLSAQFGLRLFKDFQLLVAYIHFLKNCIAFSD